MWTTGLIIYIDCRDSDILIVSVEPLTWSTKYSNTTISSAVKMAKRKMIFSFIVVATLSS